MFEYVSLREYAGESKDFMLPYLLVKCYPLHPKLIFLLNTKLSSHNDDEYP